MSFLSSSGPIDLLDQACFEGLAARRAGRRNVPAAATRAGVVAPRASRTVDPRRRNDARHPLPRLNDAERADRRRPHGARRGRIDRAHDGHPPRQLGGRGAVRAILMVTALALEAHALEASSTTARAWKTATAGCIRHLLGRYEPSSGPSSATRARALNGMPARRRPASSRGSRPRGCTTARRLRSRRAPAGPPR